MASDSDQLNMNDLRVRAFLVLFGLPFFCVGAFMAWMLSSIVSLHYASQSWIETPATLTELELSESSGDGSSTYKVEARYQYVYAGTEYISDRVGLSGMSDNFSSYHRDLYEQLRKAKQAGESSPCWVDPSDPTQALLDRTLRPVVVWFHVLFIATFGTVGAGLIAWAIWFGPRYAKKKARRQKKNPKKPWLWRNDWREKAIFHSSLKRSLPIGIFAFFWNMMVLPMSIMVWTDPDEGWFPRLFMIPFMLIGMLVLGLLLRMVIQHLFYGVTLLRLATLPGQIGGSLSGVVLVPASMAASISSSSPATAELRSEQQKGTGKERTTETLWSSEQRIDETLRPDDLSRRGLPISIEIPHDTYPTSDAADIAWKLYVRHGGPIFGYRAEFEVPVFKLPDNPYSEAVSPEDPVPPNAAPSPWDDLDDIPSK